MKTKAKLGWTYNGRLATATSGNGITVIAAEQKTAELLLKKKIAAMRRQLYK